MATTTPSYYEGGVCQDIRQKEHRFHLYMNQREEGLADSNQKIVVRTVDPKLFGVVVANDWVIRDGPAASANLVARARGMHIGAGISDESWLFCHSILFTDARFKGSSLKVLGDFGGPDGEWAIVGGTGEFAYANGVVTAKVMTDLPAGTTIGRTWELRIRAFSLCISDLMKMGPWGGIGGAAFDIPEPPRSLQSVTIGFGDVINSIAFSYTDRSGLTRSAGRWGGDGPATATITLAPSETISQVRGTTATVGGLAVVTSLTFVTNVRTYGPFGRESGSAFSTEVPAGKAVVGFHGRAGSALDAIGVYVA